MMFELDVVLLILTTIFAGLLLFSGLYFIYRNHASDVVSEVSLFGQTLKSKNVGLILVFMAVVMVVIFTKEITGRELGPDTNEIIALAESSFEQGEYNKSYEYYNQLLNEHWDNADYLGKSAYSAFKIGYINEALNRYTRLIEISPGMWHHYSNRADVYRALDKPEKAIDDLNKAISLSPANGKLYNNRGYIKYGSGYSPEEYCQDFRKASELEFKIYHESLEILGCN